LAEFSQFQRGDAFLALLDAQTLLQAIKYSAHDTYLASWLEQLWHGNRLGLGLTFATPDDIGNGQSLGRVIAAQEHRQKRRHKFGVIFTYTAPAKIAGGSRRFITMPA